MGMLTIVLAGGLSTDGRHLAPRRGPVAVQEPEHHRDGGGPAFGDLNLGEGGQGPVDFVGGDEIDDVVADHVGWLPAQQGDDRFTGVLDGAVGPVPATRFLMNLSRSC